MLQIISYCLYQQSYDVERYLFVRGCLHDTGRLLSRSEFTPVPCGSAFVYMILPENVIPARLQPGFCTGARISFPGEILHQCHVSEELDVWVDLNG